jgi:hypothetical protein
MGRYYTLMAGLGVTNLLTTFTHSLSITPANLVARPIIKQSAVTATAPLIVGSIGTNLITVAAGVGTLTTFDLEVQQIHSLIK